MFNNNLVKSFPISPQNDFPVKCRKFFENANDSTSSLRKAVHCDKERNVVTDEWNFLIFLHPAFLFNIFFQRHL